MLGLTKEALQDQLKAARLVLRRGAQVAQRKEVQQDQRRGPRKAAQKDRHKGALLDLR